MRNSGYSHGKRPIGDEKKMVFHDLQYESIPAAVGGCQIDRIPPPGASLISFLSPQQTIHELMRCRTRQTHVTDHHLSYLQLTNFLVDLLNPTRVINMY
jgi:hypothetical protein